MCTGVVFFADASRGVGSLAFGRRSELLALLDLQGTLVTADCAHWYADTFEAIQQRGAEAVIGVKKNQPTVISTTEKGHGRIEQHTYTVLRVDPFVETKTRFPTVHSVVCVTRERSVVNGRSTKITQYYRSTLPVKHAERTVQGIRSPWGIEHQWQLDTRCLVG